jgi:hypothetical protein
VPQNPVFTPRSAPPPTEPAPSPHLRVPPELAPALAAIERLTVAILAGPRKSRFHDAANLCNLGQALVRIFSESVEDFDPAAGCSADYFNVGPIVPAMPPLRRGNNVNMMMNGWPNDAQTQRDAAMSVTNVLELQAETVKSQGSAAIAAELRDLLATKDKLKTLRAKKSIDARIQILLAKMEVPSGKPQDESKR